MLVTALNEEETAYMSGKSLARIIEGAEPEIEIRHLLKRLLDTILGRRVIRNV